MTDRVERWSPPRMQRTTITKEISHYRTSDWLARRVRILVRDGYRCRDCSRVCYGKAAHVDHVIPLELGGTDADDNLACRCSACHGRKTRAEQRARNVN